MSAKNDRVCSSSPVILLTDSFQKKVDSMADWVFGTLYQRNATKKAGQSAPSREEAERRQHEIDVKIQHREEEKRLIIYLMLLCKHYARVDNRLHIRKEHLKKALNILKVLPEDAVREWDIYIQDRYNSSIIVMIEILL